MPWFHNFFMNQQQLEEKYLSAVLSVRNNLVPSEDSSDRLTFTLLCGCKLNQYGELIGECSPHREANFMNWTCSNWSLTTAWHCLKGFDFIFLCPIQCLAGDNNQNQGRGLHGFSVSSWQLWIKGRWEADRNHPVLYHHWEKPQKVQSVHAVWCCLGQHLNADIGIVFCNLPCMILAVSHDVPAKRFGVLSRMTIMPNDFEISFRIAVHDVANQDYVLCGFEPKRVRLLFNQKNLLSLIRELDLSFILRLSPCMISLLSYQYRQTMWFSIVVCW